MSTFTPAPYKNITKIRDPKFGNKDIFHVTISDEEYDVCAETPFSTDIKKGTFGRGLNNNDDDPRKVQRTGLLGEMALAKLTGESVDVAYKARGDSYDLLIAGKDTDIKTGMKNNGRNFIRVRSDSGRETNWKKSLFISAYIVSENRQERTAVVAIVGWNNLEDAMNVPEVNAWKGTHKNRELLFENTRPIMELLKLHNHYKTEMVCHGG